MIVENENRQKHLQILESKKIFDQKLTEAYGAYFKLKSANIIVEMQRKKDSISSIEKLRNNLNLTQTYVASKLMPPITKQAYNRRVNLSKYKAIKQGRRKMDLTVAENILNQFSTERKDRKSLTKTGIRKRIMNVSLKIACDLYLAKTNIKFKYKTLGYLRRVYFKHIALKSRHQSHLTCEMVRLL